MEFLYVFSIMFLLIFGLAVLVKLIAWAVLCSSAILTSTVNAIVPSADFSKYTSSSFARGSNSSSASDISTNAIVSAASIGLSTNSIGKPNSLCMGTVPRLVFSRSAIFCSTESSSLSSCRESE